MTCKMPPQEEQEKTEGRREGNAPQGTRAGHLALVASGAEAGSPPRLDIRTWKVPAQGSGF